MEAAVQTSHAPIQPAAPYTLHFTEWQCGHHWQRPADIPVHSVEQALLILQAISHAISQPGHARAMLLRDEYASRVIYLTDDYVEPEATVTNIEDSFLPRPVLHWGDAVTLTALQDPAVLAVIDEELCVILTLWNHEKRDEVCSFDERLTALTPEQVREVIERDAQNHPHGLPIFDAPPVFKPAAELLAAAREMLAEKAAREAELAEEEGGDA